MPVIPPKSVGLGMETASVHREEISDVKFVWLETILRCFSSLFSDPSGLNKAWSRVGYFSQSRHKTKELKLGKKKAFGSFCSTSHTSHANTVLPELAAAASIAAGINHERKTHCQPASGCVWGLGLKQSLCLDLYHLSARSFFPRLTLL